MTTLTEARFKLDRLLLERHAAGLPTHVEQIDVVVTELSTPSHVDALAYIYLADADDPDEDLITINFEVDCPPKLFDCRAAEHVLLRCPSDAVH